MERAVPVVIAWVVVASAITAAAGQETAASVSVRTYNYARVSPEQLSFAREEATRTFMKAGIALRWLECRIERSEDGDTTGCMDPLREGRDFILRLTATSSPPESSRVMALGSSLLDGHQRTGVLMTVDVLPIRAISEGTGVGLAVLLGRAVAHEIGHLLLGTSKHSKEGLMRALWSHDELRGVKPAHWGFSTEEAVRMRGILLRAASAN